jgi:glutaryl-CoA dehydrogenase
MLGEKDRLGRTTPKKYGGLASSFICYGLVARELKRVDLGDRARLPVPFSLSWPEPQ